MSAERASLFGALVFVLAILLAAAYVSQGLSQGLHVLP